MDRKKICIVPILTTVTLSLFRSYSSLMRAFKVLNKIRKRHSYLRGFPGWLSLVPFEEIEDIIGIDTFNKLVVKFWEDELGTYMTYSKICWKNS